MKTQEQAIMIPTAEGGQRFEDLESAYELWKLYVERNKDAITSRLFNLLQKEMEAKSKAIETMAEMSKEIKFLKSQINERNKRGQVEA